MPRKKYREYDLTPELLDAYQNAALQNSEELLIEAKLLLSNNHFGRAYFLAIACIEEAGKAQIVFEAKGRNLNDGGVVKKIKERFEDHSSKITSAFVGWLSVSPTSKESIQAAVDLMVGLKHGREKSMYIDVKEKSHEISMPREVVRPSAARDCVSVAHNCLHHTKNYIRDNDPVERTPAQDKLMCLKQGVVTDIMSREDFWDFYLDAIRPGNSDLDNALVTYHDCYFKKSETYG